MSELLNGHDDPKWDVPICPYRFADLDRLRHEADRLYVLCRSGCDEFRLIWIKWKQVSERIPVIFCFPDDATVICARQSGANACRMDGLTDEWVKSQSGRASYPKRGWMAVHLGSCLQDHKQYSRWYPELSYDLKQLPPDWRMELLPSIAERFPVARDHQPFRYATVFGAWGDCLCTLGNVRERLSQVGQKQCEAIYWGKDPSVADFLRCQRFFSRVIDCVPDEPWQYYDLIQRCVDGRYYPEGWLKDLLSWATEEVDPGPIAMTHLRFVMEPEPRPIQRWHYGILPASVREKAKQIVKDFRPDLILHPRSENSTPWSKHWPHWDEAIDFLLEQGYRIILTGKGYQVSKVHRCLLNLVNQTESMMDVFALAEACGRVICSNNSLAHWCVVQGLPAMVCLHANTLGAEDYYREWMQVPHLSLVEMNEGMNVFQEKLHQFIVPRRFTLMNSPLPKPKTLLLQHGRGEHELLMKAVKGNHESYCRSHKIDYIASWECLQWERHPIWDKIVLIREALQKYYDLIVWLDSDCLIICPDVDIREALSGDTWIGMCEHERPDLPWHLNAGAIWIRNTKEARSFFEEVWKRDYEEGWYDQQPINDILQENNFQGVKILDPVWNSCDAVNPVPDPIVKAWHNMGTPEQRLTQMKPYLLQTTNV